MVAGDPRQLVFVHGIGGIRDAATERDTWLAALARGAELPPIDVRYVDYSFEFAQDGMQGGTDVEAELLLELVDELVAELSEAADPAAETVLADARMQLSGPAEQGPGQVVRTLANVLTTVLALPGLRTTTQWASGRVMLGHLAQVSRYLRRDGLDTRIRARMHEALVVVLVRMRSIRACQVVCVS